MKMRHLLTIAIALFSSSVAFSQTQYEVLVERPNEKTYKGIISRETLLNDTTFKWYAQNLKGYTPNASGVAAFKNNTDTTIQLITFMGTWCEDSHAIIPKFYSFLDATGFSTNRVTLIGVDRNKKTISHLAEALNIINVPTIIVMKNGKELGRVVEYGKYGLFDKELGEIITAAGK